MTSYDQCAIRQLGGAYNLISRNKFEELPLATRIKLVMGGDVQFLRDGNPISVREALDAPVPR